MEFNITGRKHKSDSHYSEEDKKIAEEFAKQVHAELDEFLMAAVLFGSAATKSEKPESDIDVLLVVDDASTAVTRELTQAYRIIVEKLAAKISYRLHISTLKTTSFWQYLKDGDPILVNMLRDGIPLIDKGFFRPVQALLDQGRIRPTKEAIWSYYARVPVTLKNAKGHVMQACVDLYWAGIDAAHAALMATGEVPTSPAHVPDMLEEHLVKKGLLKKKHAMTMRELYDLSKHIEHRDQKMVSGVQFDALLKQTESLVEELRKIVREHEKKH